MKAVALYPLVGILVSTPLVPSPGQVPWINEFHYDNTGTDVDEFVEIAAPESLADLASVRLTLYNGGDGKTYGSSHLLSTFTAGSVVDGIRFYSKLIPGLQNGAPDGMSLDIGGSVSQFLSYEGTFAATAGPAAGLLSVDVGAIELDTSPLGGALALAGLGSSGGDFVWNYTGTATPGGLNPGQAVVPEPETYALMSAGGLVMWGLWRRKRAGG